ncbi:hypothetical protein A2996_00940 [Candidatus Campbellbacteria bacterium RIFCSPLOWO2_01_FULL_34_15]|uniref:Uncharacterized protein n=1 Tax=Candidatus Campbellbacteria bacterium RIFCSPLOWO2_01_FULL_34_15 TaxID=1797579 RepID=A0A1F5EN15_9BACT|nr:MAG: hypothetical protein A2996_00940 [Candidatus Campbellbacteria bacterium RIFCSPLOWO2_01_FULL_34_15]
MKKEYLIEEYENEMMLYFLKDEGWDVLDDDLNDRFDCWLENISPEYLEEIITNLNINKFKKYAYITGFKRETNFIY